MSEIRNIHKTFIQENSFGERQNEQTSCCARIWFKYTSSWGTSSSHPQNKQKKFRATSFNFSKVNRIVIMILINLNRGKLTAHINWIAKRYTVVFSNCERKMFVHKRIRGCIIILTLKGYFQQSKYLWRIFRAQMFDLCVENRKQFLVGATRGTWKIFCDMQLHKEPLIERCDI